MKKASNAFKEGPDARDRESEMEGITNEDTPRKLPSETLFSEQEVESYA